MFGNTERIARAIAAELQNAGRTEIRSIQDGPSILPVTDLLVVGGPTRAHGMSAEMKNFLDALPVATLHQISVAAFDTRLQWPVLLSGSAARGIANQLGRQGIHLIVEPESFFVDGREGPLLVGELEHAAIWARELASSIPRVA
jgi:flavodoxin